MGYRNLRDCVADLERHEQAGPHRRGDRSVSRNGRDSAAGLSRPAARRFSSRRVKGCPFPMVSNLFGTLERTRFLFRDTLEAVRHLVELKIDPPSFWKNPWRYRDVPGRRCGTRLPTDRPQWAGPAPADDD